MVRMRLWIVFLKGIIINPAVFIALYIFLNFVTNEDNFTKAFSYHNVDLRFQRSHPINS